MRAAAFLLFGILIFSCKEESVISSGIDGKWQGTLAEVRFKPLGLPVPVNRDVPSFDTRIDFNKDGTMVVWDGADPKNGTYDLRGNDLVINIDYSIEDISLAGTYRVETLTDTQLVINITRDHTVSDPDGGPSVSGEVKVTLHFDRI